MQEKKGAIWNMLGSTMYGVNSFIMLALVSRIGTVEQAGYYGIAFTTAQLLYIVGLFGVPHYQMTDYAEKYSFSSYAKARIVSVFGMLLCCAGVIFALGFVEIKRVYTVVLTFLMVLNVIGELYQSLFFQKNRLDLSGSALFFRTFWSLTGFCVVISVTRNILWALLVQIAINLTVTGYYAFFVAPQFFTKQRKNSASMDNASTLLVECFPLAVSLFLMNMIINMSKYGIEFVMDDTTQGYYNMIFMPAQVINLCSQFLFKPFLNQYSTLLAQKKNAEFLCVLKKQILFVAVFTLICCAGAFLLGVQVLGFVYGKDLSAFVLPLTLVVFGGGIYAVCELFYYVLVIMRQQKSILKVYITALFVSGVLTLLMISQWELLGAVLAFSATHMLILAGFLFVMCNTLKSQST